MRWWERRNADLDEEIEMHMRLAAAERVSHGEAPEAALAAARREFGNELHVREATRSMWHFSGLERFAHDFRIGLRALKRTPRFFIAAVICMAIGISVTTTILSAVHAVWLRPLPYPNASRTLALRAISPHEIGGEEVSIEILEAWKKSRAFSRIGAWRTSAVGIAGEESLPETVESAQVTPEVFGILGTRPITGRIITAGDVAAGRNVAVLGYDLWHRDFGGSPAIIGRTINIREKEYEIIGVMPREFSFPEGSELWTSLVVEKSLPAFIVFYHGVIAERAPRVGLESARADFNRLTSSVTTAGGYKDWKFEARPLQDDLRGALRRPVIITQGAALVVLLIACANIAALLLARSAARHREFAVRAAIGANRRRLIVQVLTESMALATVGGVLGVALSFIGVRLMRTLFVDGVPSYIDLSVRGPVLAMAALAICIAAILFGAAPAIVASRARASSTLEQGVRGGVGMPRARAKMRNLLVSAEIAASVVLLIAAVLLMRTERNLEASLGFRPQGVVSFSVPLPRRYYNADDSVPMAFYSAVRDRLRSIAGVDGVSTIVMRVPLDGPSGGYWPFLLDGEQKDPHDLASRKMTVMHYVDTGYVRLMGARMLTGRFPESGDAHGSLSTKGEFGAVVNKAFADEYFPRMNPLGQRVRIDMGGPLAPPFRIVGVVSNIRDDRPPAPVKPALYVSDAGNALTQTFVLRTHLQNPAVLGQRIREIVHDVDPAVVPGRLQTQVHIVERAFWRERLQRNVITVFATLAVMLAMFGIYGVLSYAVDQRTSELGLRMALGATTRQLRFLVMRDAGRVLAGGLAAGILLALVASRVLTSFLFGISTADPFTYAVVSATLGCVVFMAAFIPVRRIARLNPVAALIGP